MTLRLPTTLATDSDAVAVEALTKYYGRPYLGDDAYVGAYFDSWFSTKDRAGEADRFTADDLVAAGVPVGAGPRADALRPPAGTGRGWRISLGVCAGLLLGFFCYLPTVMLWQHYGNVLQPRVYPHGSFSSFGPDPPPVEYWVSWAGPAVVVVACGLMTVPWRPARQFALPFGGPAPADGCNGRVVHDRNGTVFFTPD
ncbi:DUF6308 family protein [Rhodococcus oxybenzonivorans]|uniref:DUF6308 family protein n=1 Tax=Rhodococcus oxybenzonivorans TaxID=1990687 RepID=UPI001E373E54|nr:DUF6308 family protein [Rhodococcus oxybenzonivorans]